MDLLYIYYSHEVLIFSHLLIYRLSLAFHPTYVTLKILDTDLNLTAVNTQAVLNFIHPANLCSTSPYLRRYGR